MSAVGLLGSRPVAAAFAAANRRSLRALAYHAVNDPMAFGAQLDLFQRLGLQTVTAAQVADALNGGMPLPARALWITFDDGDVSVVRNALPQLQTRGMVATAFLCGAWVATSAAPWWEVLQAAVSTNELDSTRRALKAAPDAQRRASIEQMEARLAAAGTPVIGRQWSIAQVAAWRAAGNDIGNHSWDHPCLDRCDDAEQRRQVRLAHQRLSALAGDAINVFAWPNGDAAPAALDELHSLGYRVVAVCDHRLASRTADPFGLSRLKIDADVGLDRTRAIISGGHSTVFHVHQRIRGKRRDSDVT